MHLFRKTETWGPERKINFELESAYAKAIIIP